VIGLNRGDAGIAVQASSVIEGRFAPVMIRGELAQAEALRSLHTR